MCVERIQEEAISEQRGEGSGGVCCGAVVEGGLSWGSSKWLSDSNCGEERQWKSGYFPPWVGTEREAGIVLQENGWWAKVLVTRVISLCQSTHQWGQGYRCCTVQTSQGSSTKNQSRSKRESETVQEQNHRKSCQGTTQQDKETSIRNEEPEISFVSSNWKTQ